MGWAELIAALAQVAGPLIGQAMASGDRGQIMKLLQDSLDEYGRINVPTLQQLVLKSIPDTELAKIANSTAQGPLKEADAALKELSERGLSLGDEAALNQLRNQTSQALAQQRAATEQSMAARGQLSGGALMGSNLAAQQQAANRLSQEDMNIAAQQQARSFEAIKQRAQLASQQLGRESDAARAQDAINAGNIAIQNLASQYNSQLPQQNFNNQMALAGAKNQAKTAMAGGYGASAKDTAQTGANIGNGLANTLLGYEKLKAGKQTGQADSTSSSPITLTEGPLQLDREPRVGTEEQPLSSIPPPSGNFVMQDQAERLKQLPWYEQQYPEIFGRNY